MFQYSHLSVQCISVFSVELHVNFFLVGHLMIWTLFFQVMWCYPLLPAIVDDERLSAEEMDERRRQNIAYEYLCHLEEAKR